MLIVYVERTPVTSPEECNEVKTILRRTVLNKANATVAADKGYDVDQSISADEAMCIKVHVSYQGASVRWPVAPPAGRGMLLV